MKANANKNFQRGLKEIKDLYGETTFSALYNDLVAIGSVPTPDLPAPSFIVSKNVIAIGTVPVPDIRKKLKKIIKRLLEISNDSKMEELLK